jgi:hypothetical protein
MTVSGDQRAGQSNRRHGGICWSADRTEKFSRHDGICWSEGRTRAIFASWRYLLISGPNRAIFVSWRYLVIRGPERAIGVTTVSADHRAGQNNTRHEYLLISGPDTAIFASWRYLVIRGPDTSITVTTLSAHQRSGHSSRRHGSICWSADRTEQYPSRRYLLIRGPDRAVGVTTVSADQRAGYSSRRHASTEMLQTMMTMTPIEHKNYFHGAGFKLVSPSTNCFLVPYNVTHPSAPTVYKTSQLSLSPVSYRNSWRPILIDPLTCDSPQFLEHHHQSMLAIPRCWLNYLTNISKV